MMKPANPPVRGTLHKALSEGCGMWAPVVVPVRKSSQAERQVDQVDAVSDDPLLAGSRSGEGSAATAAGINPQGLFSAHQSKNQRSDKQDDEYKEQDLCNLYSTCGDAGKTE